MLWVGFLNIPVQNLPERVGSYIFDPARSIGGQDFVSSIWVVLLPCVSLKRSNLPYIAANFAKMKHPLDLSFTPEMVQPVWAIGVSMLALGIYWVIAQYSSQLDFRLREIWRTRARRCGLWRCNRDCVLDHVAAATVLHRDL